MEPTEQQRSIIHSTPRTRVVFAAPGSGKTATLIAHLSWLLEKRLVVPGEVMALTYTRKAALEMKQRLLRVPGIRRAAVEAIRMGTFHAQLFAALLALDPSIPRIMDGQMQSRLIRRAVQADGRTLNHWELREWQQALSNLANDPFKSDQRRLRSVLRRYKKLKREANVWDFDDILTESVDVLHRHGVDKLFRRPISYLLIDEFQDTNEVQFTILRTVVERFSSRLFVVGDDDQSIYGFRGASPYYLNHFRDVFLDAEESELTVNFRSSQPLLEPAWQLIGHNQARRPKRFSAARQTGLPIDVRNFATQQSQYEFVACAIRSQPLASQRAKNAVLARTRRQLQAFVATVGRLPDTVVSTFHEAKGREWDAVYLLDACEPNPYVLHQPGSDSEREEERRLFYVAMTRAKHKLTVCVPQRLGSVQTHPSRYLEESGILSCARR